MPPRKRKPMPPPPCETCDGTGYVTRTVLVGRRDRQRPVGQQDGWCLSCLGTGYASASTT